MLGAIHFGVLAACFVLFVPMAMAGWHLSRNKMLFFSGVMFISLAVCVHLTPYFPSVSDIVASVSSVAVYDHRVSCINEVNQIVWDVRPRPNPESVNNGSKLDQFEKNWDWEKSKKVSSCEFQKLDQSDVSELLNGSWVVVAGDSQARFVALSLLNLVLGSDSEAMGLVKGDLFKRHSDYNIVVKEIGMKLDFVWAPYEKDLDDLVVSYKKKKKKKNKKNPDVVIMGSGLWHMLHVNNASDFGFRLKELSNHVESLLPFTPKEQGEGSVSGRSMHLFWIGMPVLINGMLNTDEKKEKMSDTVWHEYDRSLGESKILRQTGGPLVLLDIQSFTWNCGPRCTLDGMHYDSAVYDAAVHVMLNALLIESHQTL